MSTVAMLLFFLMLLAYIQNILTGRRLVFFQAELENTRLRLAQLNAELDTSRTELETSLLELDDTRLNLEQVAQRLEDTRWNLMQTEDEIAEKEEALKNLEDEIFTARSEIEEGRRQLSLSRQEIESQQEIIYSSNLELGNLRSRLSEIAVFRVSILEKVSKSIEEEIGKYTETGEERVSIGPNANIIINETLLFDYASAVVKDEAKQLLDQLALAFERMLDDPEIRLYIDYISIEGHTDSTGGSGYNRGLSADRAVSVVNYMMESNPNLETNYASYFGIGGFSKFRPLDAGEDEEAKAKNRRIEISVVVKDENIRRMIEEYLGDAIQ
jgi:chemotaxis protein MotB